jgi:short subunit dehydrogenase-like uncharacterized protein
MQKSFTKTVLIIATGFLGFFPLVLPLEAKSQETGKSCEAAMNAAKERIERGRNITVKISVRDNSRAYSDHPSGRPDDVGLILVGSIIGSDADSVMASPVFQKAIATEIIRSCNSIGSVTFNKNLTGWTSTIGLMSDGTIQLFKCYEYDQGRSRLSWGLQNCDL